MSSITSQRPRLLLALALMLPASAGAQQDVLVRAPRPIVVGLSVSGSSTGRAVVRAVFIGGAAGAVTGAAVGYSACRRRRPCDDLAPVLYTTSVGAAIGGAAGLAYSLVRASRPRHAEMIRSTPHLGAPAMRPVVTRVMAAAASLTVWGTSASAQSTAASELPRLLSRLYAAINRGDSATVRSLVADDVVWVIGANGAAISTSQLVAAAGTANPARFELDSVRVHESGAAVVVDYIRTDRRVVGQDTVATRWRALATFTPVGREWKLAGHSLSWLASPVKGIELDSAAMQPFVGRYRIARDYVDDVHWEGGRLVATASGQSVGAQLVPVSATTFSPDGVGAVLTFERDARGRVIGYVQAYPDGRVVRAARIP